MARFNEEKINKQILRLKAIRKKYALEDKGIIGDYCRASTDKHIDNFFSLCYQEDKYLTNLPEEDVNLPSEGIVTGTVTISECGGKCLIYDGKEWVDIVNFLKKKELNLMFGRA